MRPLRIFGVALLVVAALAFAVSVPVIVADEFGATIPGLTRANRWLWGTPLVKNAVLVAACVVLTAAGVLLVRQPEVKFRQKLFEGARLRVRENISDRRTDAALEERRKRVEFMNRENQLLKQSILRQNYETIEKHLRKFGNVPDVLAPIEAPHDLPQVTLENVEAVAKKRDAMKRDRESAKRYNAAIIKFNEAAKAHYKRVQKAAKKGHDAPEKEAIEPPGEPGRLTTGEWKRMTDEDKGKIIADLDETKKNIAAREKLESALRGARNALRNEKNPEELDRLKSELEGMRNEFPDSENVISALSGKLGEAADNARQNNRSGDNANELNGSKNSTNYGKMPAQKTPRYTDAPHRPDLLYSDDTIYSSGGTQLKKNVADANDAINDKKKEQAAILANAAVAKVGGNRAREGEATTTQKGHGDEATQTVAQKEASASDVSSQGGSENESGDDMRVAEDEVIAAGRYGHAWQMIQNNPEIIPEFKEEDANQQVQGSNVGFFNQPPDSEQTAFKQSTSKRPPRKQGKQKKPPTKRLPAKAKGKKKSK